MPDGGFWKQYAPGGEMISKVWRRFLRAMAVCGWKAAQEKSQGAWNRSGWVRAAGRWSLFPAIVLLKDILPCAPHN